MKTSELTGAALDWAVAKCNGHQAQKLSVRGIYIEKPGVDCDDFFGWDLFSPSTNWAQGGSIIEREDISFRKYYKPGSEAHGKYYAKVCRESGMMVSWKGWGAKPQTGETPLIAAMRCYVFSKLGDDVELPDELDEAPPVHRNKP